MKIETSKLAGAALDWAVARCEGVIWAAPDGELLGSASGMNYSTDWSQGGPIIERERICVAPMHGAGAGNLNDWIAQRRVDGKDVDSLFCERGATALISAMRCYVASKLGDEVEIPEELL